MQQLLIPNAKLVQLSPEQERTLDFTVDKHKELAVLSVYKYLIDFAYQWHSKTGLPQEDIFQTCMMQFCIQLPKFDPDRGRLITFANQVFLSAVQYFIEGSRMIRIPHSVVQDRRKLKNQENGFKVGEDVGGKQWTRKRQRLASENYSYHNSAIHSHDKITDDHISEGSMIYEDSIFVSTQPDLTKIELEEYQRRFKKGLQRVANHHNPRYIEIFKMFVVEGKSYAEIAEQEQFTKQRSSQIILYVFRRIAEYLPEFKNPQQLQNLFN